MTACSARLRTLGTGAAGMEESGNRLVRYLYDHLVDGRTGTPACALLRLFRTQAYARLSPVSQALAQKMLGPQPASAEMKCLGLLATAGDRAEWNDPEQSVRYKAIPLISSKFVAQFPMFAQLFTQLGVDVDTTLQQRSNCLLDADEHTFNVFHVPDAIGSPFIPAQEEFVIPYGIRSVLGFGGLLPSGDLFVVVLFAKVVLPRMTADLFKPLALSVKLALLPFDDSPAVASSQEGARRGGAHPIHRDAHVAALEQLLAVHEEAVITNAVQRKRAEEALEQSQSRLRNLIEHAPDVIFTLSLDGVITSLNPIFETLTHWSRHDWIGKPFGLLVHPDDAPTADEIFRYIVKQQCPITYALRIRTRERGALTGEFVGTPLIEDGQVVGVLSIGRDISERKMIEQALRESEEQLRSIVQSTKDAIVSLDRHGQVVFWNRGAEDMFGYAAECMIGQPVARVIPERFRDAHRRGVMRAATAGHLTVSGTMFELVGLRQDGTEFPLEFTLAAWKAQAGLFFTGIMRDITDRKRAEEALGALVQGTAPVTGEEFFSVFVRQLAAALRVPYAYVTEVISRGPDRVLVVAGWEDGGPGAPFAYDLKQTPCEVVSRDRRALYTDRAGELFPKDPYVNRYGVSSYLGVPMVGTSGEIIGHVSVMDRVPLTNDQQATSIMTIFAARAAAELERLHTTAALRQSEARQALILNVLPIAFYTLDVGHDFRTTWVSDNFQRLTGFSSRDVIESPGFWLTRLHPEDRARVQADVKRGRDAGTVSTEYRWQMADGSYRWYLDNAVYTRHADGRPKELIGAWIDITHRKRVEDALRESEERFKAFMDHNPAIIFMKDDQGRHVYVNREFERSLQVKTDEWSGRTDDELWPHEVAGQFRKTDEQVVDSHGVVDTVASTVNKHGLHQYWRVIKFPITDVAGKRYLGGIAVDVTARKNAEIALLESEERLRLSLSATRLGIWDWNITGGQVVWSDTVKQIFGISMDASAHTYEFYVNVIHPDDRGDVLQAITRSVEDGAVYELEHRVVWPDGSVHWVACKGEVFRDPAGRAVRMLGTVQDITERKAGDVELQSALKRLRTLSGRLEIVREEERGRIARELHDEFGVGLTCLKIDLSRLAGLIGPTAELEKGRQIEEKIRLMSEFIDTTIHGVQRLVSELRPAILDDLGLVAALEWQAQDFQRRTGLACTLCIEQEHVDVDPDRATVVFRICQEALTNVARHANATTVRVQLEERYGMLTLEVTDNGQGIDGKKIVDPTSLGLIGMRERAELFGGSVRIAGCPAGGTMVVLRLQSSRPLPAVEGSC